MTGGWLGVACLEERVETSFAKTVPAVLYTRESVLDQLIAMLLRAAITG